MPLIIRSTVWGGLLVMVPGCKTVLTASTSRMSPCVIVRKLAWISGLIPLAVREAWSFSEERARAVQVYSLRRQAARQEPAQSPVAPKKAIVRVVDIVVCFCYRALQVGVVCLLVSGV